MKADRKGWFLPLQVGLKLGPMLACHMLLSEKVCFQFSVANIMRRGHGAHWGWPSVKCLLYFTSCTMSLLTSQIQACFTNQSQAPKLRREANVLLWPIDTVPGTLRDPQTHIPNMSAHTFWVTAKDTFEASTGFKRIQYFSLGIK